MSSGSNNGNGSNSYIQTSIGSETDTGKVIVLHPGSKYLHFGFASDLNPFKVLHCIARRRQRNDDLKFIHKDPFIVEQSKLDGLAFQNIEDARLQIAQSLANSFKSDGSRRFLSPTKQVASMNAKVSPKSEKIDQLEKKYLFPTDEFIVGDEVQYIHKDAHYNIHFPYKRGDINLHSGIGGSQTSILVDLETIWTYCIETMLQVPRAEFGSYRVVLVIPALYKHSLIKHYLTLLLSRMGFGAGFVIQDHVAATFGSGLASACVVDVGDQKISVSCVEDGISHPASRIQLTYGGGDITQIYFYLLRKVGFPYKKCDPLTYPLDAKTLNELKEDHCHLNLDICGIMEKKIEIQRPEETHVKYTLYVGDEVMIAPASLFHTELLELTGSGNRVQLFTPDPGDSEDPHDLLYLNDTSRKYTKAGDPSTGDMDVSQSLDDDLDIVLDNSTGGSAAVTSENVISLDQAVLRSIEACPSDDIKKKMYSCILLVGGGIKFKGVTQFLRQRLALQVPHSFRSEPMDIIIDAKDMSAETTTWRGAAILAGLESASELWIKPKEFAKHGQKLLREKAPFPWS